MLDAAFDSRRGPPRFDLVVIAASAGGLAALVGVLAALPRDFPLPIAVVQHVDPNRPSLLAGLLGRRTTLRVKQAERHDPLSPGVVYVAPPGHHMIITATRTIELSHAAARALLDYFSSYEVAAVYEAQRMQPGR